MALPFSESLAAAAGAAATEVALPAVAVAVTFYASYSVGEYIGEKTGISEWIAVEMAGAWVWAVSEKESKGELIEGSEEIHTDHKHGPYTDGHRHWEERHTDPKTGKTRIIRRTGPLNK
jgi:uncharacterized protein (DUF1786 family)